MTLTFSSKDWESYLYWQTTNEKILKRINTLIKEIQRNSFEGIGNTRSVKTQPVGLLVKVD